MGLPHDLSRPLVPISSWGLAGFHRIAQKRLARAFRAIRLANQGRVPAESTRDLVVALNHPSWWDPLVGFVLARYLFPARNFYAPMDAVALGRYGIFRRLGLFPVDMGTPRGAAQFLRSAGAVLDAGAILAITPQGHFADVRERPVQLRPGLAALIRRRTAQGRAVTVLPLALEYTFWDQRLPEILVNCGTPICIQEAGQDSENAGVRHDVQGKDVHAALEEAMTTTQDELAGLAIRRDPSDFVPVLQGDRGSAGFYGLLERLRSLVGGNPQRGDHRSVPAQDRTRHDETP